MTLTRPTPIRLLPADAARYIRLRRRMLEDSPWAFGASPEDDQALDPAFVTEVLGREENAVFAVEAPVRPSNDPAVANMGEPLPGAGADGPGRATTEHPLELIAAAGIYRETARKFAHRAKIWGVFVAPEYRGLGLGKTILRAAIDLAHTWNGVAFIDLGVSENAPEARKLYASLGFCEWGREPEATAIAGRRYDEIHMTLRL